MNPITSTTRRPMSRLVAGLLLLPLAVAAVPAPAFALRAVGLEEGKERERVAEILNVPASARPAPTQLTGLEEAKELTLEETQAKLGVAPPVGATHGLWVPALDRSPKRLTQLSLWVVDPRIDARRLSYELHLAADINVAGPSDVPAGQDMVLAMADTDLTSMALPAALTIRLVVPTDADLLNLSSVDVLRKAGGADPVVVYWCPKSEGIIKLDGRQGYLFYA